MCRAWPGTKLPAMERKINLNRELELDQGQLSGRATDEDGAGKSFSGWLGLIGAIDGFVGDEGVASLQTTSNGTESADADR